jgi:hypothetical protein
LLPHHCCRCQRQLLLPWLRWALLLLLLQQRRGCSEQWQE